MLQKYYGIFGFGGSILISLLGFLFLLFWFTGIAGLIEDCDDEVEPWKVLLFMLFPPYPICWLIYDMYKQRQYMNSDVDKHDNEEALEKSIDL